MNDTPARMTRAQASAIAGWVEALDFCEDRYEHCPLWPDDNAAPCPRRVQCRSRQPGGMVPPLQAENLARLLLAERQRVEQLAVELGRKDVALREIVEAMLTTTEATS